MPLVSTDTNGNNALPDCSVIIPVYNGRDYTRNCIEALLVDESEATFELIVVDNGSTDGVSDYLEQVKGKMLLLSPGRNLGFAAANNLAARSARGKYLVLLNNDTVPEQDWLDSMVELIETDPKIGIVGAKLLYPLNRLVQHAGVVFNDMGNPSHIYERFPEDHPAVNKVRDFQAVTAACMLIKKEIYHQAGGFDEQYINGFEDVDFCFKVRESGWRIVYQPKSVVLHFEGMSKGRHQHETANGMLLWKRWGNKIVPDDREYFAEDGYELIRTGKNNIISPKGVNLTVDMSKARELLKEGRLSEALDIYETCYYQVPHSPVIMHYLVRIYQKRGDLEKAELMLFRLSTVETDRRVLQRLTENTFKSKKYDLVRKFAQGVLEAQTKQDRHSAEAWAIMGDASFKTGDLGRAAEEYNKSLSICSDLSRALIGTGTLALQKGDFTVAMERFNAAQKADPHSSRTILGKGLTYLGLGDKETAIEFIREALMLDPENSWMLTLLTSLLTEIKRYEEADQYLSVYLDLYPDDPPILLARAGVAFADKRYDDSSDILGQVLGIDPNYEAALELKGELDKMDQSRSNLARMATA